MHLCGGSRIVLVAALWAGPASAQLSKWLARDLNGVYVMDLSTPSPTVGPFISGLGTGGTEDVNMMTDAANNILFSVAVDDVNMISVFDASMNQMPNGFGLSGHTSTLQSAICPIPCHPDQYFIIHLVTGVGDLYYSIVDMSLNGGLGDVTIKNVLIGTAFTEGLAIGRQRSNGCRWLFTSSQNGNSYDLVRCLISQSGIGPPAVIASVTTIAPAYNFNEIELSADNTRLAMNVYTTSPLEPDIALWDLDLNSGTVSNPQTFSVSSDPIIGLQFSPLGNYLFYVANGNTDDMDFGRVEVATGSPELIDPFMGRYLTMVELAGNGRIYVGLNYNSNYMAEVTDPDNLVLASIGYNHNAVYISGTGCRPPLPNAIEGEPPGSTTTPGFIDFSAYAIGGCDTYQFVDSTCLATWWEWDLGDGTVTNDQAPIHQFAAGTYDITLRVVACGDTLTLMRPAYVNSSSAPVTAAFSMVPDTLCAGSAVQLINTSLTATTQEWDFGDGTSSAEVSPIHVYSASGSYLVQLIAANGCSADTVMAEVTVLGTEAEALVISDYCHTVVQVISSSLNAGTLLWLFGDGTNSSDSATTHDFASAGTYDILLVVDPGSACADTVITTVTVGIGPVADFASVVLCDQMVDLENESSPGATLAWYFGDGTGSTLPSLTHMYPGTGPYDVQLIATDILGCTDTAFATVSPLPTTTAAFNLLSGPCDREQAFESTSVGAIDLAWSFGDGGTDTVQAPFHAYPSAGEYDVVLIVNPGTPCADTTNTTVILADLPVAAFTDSLGCAMNAFFEDASLNANDLEWLLGDGTISSEAHFEHTYLSPGPYTVFLQASNAAGCIDSISATIVVLPAVSASFSSGFSECSAAWDFSTTSTNALQQVWEFGDGATSTQPTPTHMFSQQGTFMVQLIATGSNGCMDTAVAVIDATDSGILPEIFVPNCFTPNGDGVNDRFEVGGIPDCFEVEMLVFDRWGEVIFEDDGLQGWSGDVDGGVAPDGTYVFLLTGNGEQRYGTVTLLR